jgi:hypothetical protein
MVAERPSRSVPIQVKRRGAAAHDKVLECRQASDAGSAAVADGAGLADGADIASPAVRAVRAVRAAVPAPRGSLGIGFERVLSRLGRGALGPPSG